MHRHTDLNVWRRSIDLCVDIYGLTAALPLDERYGLSTQMRRAAVSVSSNIAEGSAFRSSKQFRRFLEIALGSAQELDTQLIVAERAGLMPPTAIERARSELREIRAMIVGLHRSI